jgi:hypothetical protein
MFLSLCILDIVTVVCWGHSVQQTGTVWDWREYFKLSVQVLQMKISYNMWGVIQMIHKEVTVFKVSQLIVLVMQFELCHSYRWNWLWCTYVRFLVWLWYLTCNMYVVASECCRSRFTSEKYDTVQSFDPLPLLFKALLQGQKDWVLFIGHLTLCRP